MKHIMIILVLIFAVNCGSIPSAQEIVDAVSNEFNNNSESGDSTDTESVENNEDSEGVEREVQGGGFDDPINPTFMGTFEKTYATTCSYYPTIMRMYTDGTKVYYQDQTGRWVIGATIFQDDTFDFTSDVVNEFGTVVSDQTCTCRYTDGGTYYKDYFQCTCEIQNPLYDIPSSTCKLDYDQL